jgi:hypothetical protein
MSPPYRRSIENRSENSIPLIRHIQFFSENTANSHDMPMAYEIQICKYYRIESRDAQGDFPGKDIPFLYRKQKKCAVGALLSFYNL